MAFHLVRRRQIVSQCRQRIENLPDCEVSIENLPRGSHKNRFTKSPALSRLEAGLVATANA